MPITVLPVAGDQITIEIFSGVSSNVGVENVGAGAGVFKEQIETLIRLRSLVAGAGITITENTDDITVAATSVPFTPNKAIVSNGSGLLIVSSTTDTEIGYVSGVTSAIQDQIDGKQDTITGAATTVTSLNLVADRLLISDGSGKIAVGPTSTSDLANITGGTSNYQTQINNITASLGNYLLKSGGTMTGIINMGSNKITNLANGTAAGDAVNKSQLDSTVGAFDINIGTWNIGNSVGQTLDVNVVHGQADYTKIRVLSIMLIGDSGLQYLFMGADATTVRVSSTHIYLQVTDPASFWAGNSFDDPAITNRGYITIKLAS